MTAPQITCPWWCTDHRSGPTVEDEQHAHPFVAPDGTWVALLCGVLPDDRIELAHGGESFDRGSARARRLAAALQQAADLLDRITTARDRAP